MSRSLPLAGPSDPATATEPSPGAGVPLTRAAAPSPDPGALHGTVAVFDPAMCCPTGVCGAGVDPALLQIARDLRWLTARGVQVRRAGLSQEPQAFVADARVSALMRDAGEQALPAVLVNDAVLAHGRYPSRDELVAALTAGETATEGPAA